MESLRDTTRAASLSVASVFMRHVYQWMTVGLLVTAATAFFVASSPAILSMLFGNTISLVILAIAVFAIAEAATVALVSIWFAAGGVAGLGHVDLHHLRGHVRRHEHLRYRDQA